MLDCREAFRDAVAHHQASRPGEAAALYRRILDAEPGNLAALNNLAMLLRADNAVPLLRLAVALRPDYGDALVNLAAALERQGEHAEALAYFERALPLAPRPANIMVRMGALLDALDAPDAALGRYRGALAIEPDSAVASLALAGALYRRGDLDAAAAQYEHALAIDPDAVEALGNLGTISARRGQPAVALDYYFRALRIDPDLAVANLNGVTLLEAEGRLEECRPLRARVPRPQPLVVRAAPEPRRTVLVLSSFGNGNVPVEMILPARTTTRITWYVDHATDAQEAALPEYDVAFNAIGNADTTEASLARATRFHARRPVLNAPDRVERTRRDRMPALLAGIPGVLVPPVVRLDRDTMARDDLAATLGAHGVPCPVLIRPLSSQGGKGMVLVETADALHDRPPSPSDASYCIGYHDSRSPDGYYRKYRVLYVDGQAHAYHLAISKHWLVHYFSADMLDGDWKREEERRFLDDPPAALGRDGWAAVEAIGRRMGLDYGGIDFALLPDGRILVFEANATMSLHLFEPIALFPYKHVHVPAIARAFDAMLTRHAAATAAAPPR